jgi:hypothetical protein
MITDRLGIGGVHVMVHPDLEYGWQPTVVTVPAEVVRCQQLVEGIAAELRTEFELKA